MTEWPSLVLLALILAGAVAAWVWLRRQRRELAVLQGATERLAQGQYGHTVFAPPGLGLSSLAAAFNAMSEQLAAQFSRLEEDQQQLRAILSGMVEGVVALDAQQRILFANERACQLLEFGTVQVVGRRLWEVVRQRSVQDLVSQALADARPQRADLDWKGQNEKSLAVHAAPLPRSPSRGVILVLHDITDLRRLERIRQEFVANVSHELKTPLAVIVACIETLLEGGAIDDLEHRDSFLEQISEQAQRLHALVLDMLSLARLETGTEAFEAEAIPLVPLIASCLERHRARADAKQQVLEQHPDSLTATAWADEEAVSHILDNLVDNAVKYTPEGGRITVRCFTDDGQVGIEVADTGIGIPDRDLARIFERFYRVDKARSRELGGTGLGLSIVKHLVQGQHGTIGAVSQLGQGSTFTVRLPAARLPAVAAAAKPAWAASRRSETPE